MSTVSERVPVPVDGSHPLTSRLLERDVVVDADLSRPDWQQPDRFRTLNQRYGAWGLCLLEAVVRQADHAVSAGVAPAGWEVV